MSKPLLVSVLIRSTDRKSFLEQALTSVANQTYNSIEVVLISAIPSHSQPPTQAGIFPIRFIDSDVYLTRSDAANRGLQNSSGDYLLILDDDDIIFPEHIQKLVEAMKEFDLTCEKLVAVFTDYEVVDSDLKSPRASGSPHYNPLKLLCGNFMTTFSVLFKRQVLDQGCSFDRSLAVYEDWDFWIQLSQCGEFKKVEGVSAYYRIHESSGVHNIKPFYSIEHQRVYTKWMDGEKNTNRTKLIEFAWNSFVQLDEQKETLTQLKNEIDLAHVNHADRLKRLNALTEEKEYLLKEIKTNQELNQSLEAKLYVNNLNLKEALNEMKQLRHDNSMLQKDYADILRSRSWRLTAPFRDSVYLLKRLIGLFKRLAFKFTPSFISKKLRFYVDMHGLSWLIRISSSLPWKMGALVLHITSIYKKAPNHKLIPFEIYKNLNTPTLDQDFALLVTFAPNGLINEPTIYYLEQLVKKSIHVVLCIHVDNDNLEFKYDERLDSACSILVRKNSGFDFPLWASALTAMPELFQAKKIIFTNDSILGPFSTFDQLLKKIENNSADFIALTDSHQLLYHVQSYFFVLKQKALINPVVRAFWSQVLSFQRKTDVIHAYELNLAKVFGLNGKVKHDVIFKANDLKQHKRGFNHVNFNPTHQEWRNLVSLGFPFIKTELLQKNPTNTSIKDWDLFIAVYCNDLKLITIIKDYLEYLSISRVR